MLIIKYKVLKLFNESLKLVDTAELNKIIHNVPVVAVKWRNSRKLGNVLELFFYILTKTHQHKHRQSSVQSQGCIVVVAECQSVVLLDCMDMDYMVMQDVDEHYNQVALLLVFELL